LRNRNQQNRQLNLFWAGLWEYYWASLRRTLIRFDTLFGNLPAL